ncbi:MAG TPA: excisionase family DNA-binding protein [Gemmataceae bacterium]|jgi:excisionase family DNA binding protein|nr:excisionase family DNA-binding protein [Gemmataceae bacterium]
MHLWLANSGGIMVSEAEPTKAWITTARAAQLYGLSRWTPWRWAQDGKVPSIRLGRDVLVDRRAVERRVRERAVV